MIEQIVTWVNQQLAAYLRGQGWVVFYLDENIRHCRVNLDVRKLRPENHRTVEVCPGPHEGCWLALYQQQEHAAAGLGTDSVRAWDTDDLQKRAPRRKLTPAMEEALAYFAEHPHEMPADLLARLRKVLMR